MTPPVVIVTPGLFAATAAAMIAARVAAAISERGSCSLALCGGNTPVPVYRQLAALDIDWASVAIYFGDERAVPPDDPDSNFLMARRALLDRLPVPPHAVHRMAAERPDIARAANEYEQLLPLQLDVLLLGVGPDGHVASLFPGSPGITESGRRVMAVASPPPPVRPQVGRMTITALVIAAAREIVTMVAGAEKAPRVAQILDGPDRPMELPAQLARRGTWVLDAAAAGQLQQEET